MPSKDKLDNVVYEYSGDSSQLEAENRILKEALENLKNEVNRFKENPLLVCEIREIIGDKAIIRVPNGSSFFVNISSDCEKLNVGDSVLAEQKNLTIIKKINATKNYDVDKFVIIDKPKVKYSEIGGLDIQIKEMKEVIELPLKKPHLFKKVGIQPPKGILLYGPPGTGKTLLAKAVASSTHSTFIEIVGSELVQKFIGEGAKLVKEIFNLAKEKAPSIIFIDELDALAATRIDVGTSGEREVQRTFMQLLSEIDGFKHLGNVKIIGCTNRKDILDPAITRPGRLDRLIRVDIPNDKAKLSIFDIHTKGMSLERDVNKQRIISKMENFSGAEIRAVCTEAGYFAIRKNKTKVGQKDFLEGVKKVKQEEEREGKDYMRMFG
jgi:proteasome regulatory subunit